MCRAAVHPMRCWRRCRRPTALVADAGIQRQRYFRKQRQRHCPPSSSPVVPLVRATIACACAASAVTCPRIPSHGAHTVALRIYLVEGIEEQNNVFFHRVLQLAWLPYAALAGSPWGGTAVVPAAAARVRNMTLDEKLSMIWGRWVSCLGSYIPPRTIFFGDKRGIHRNSLRACVLSLRPPPCCPQ